MSMLVLTRKQGEQLVIGDNIKVGVVQITGHKVVLSFEAPGAIRILRAELGNWQEGMAARALDPADDDLRTKPAEWDELRFGDARKRASAGHKKLKRRIQA
jgi:carbon storage regulator